ncbi:hypothetical protein BT10792_24430 [Bacillus thuringiensis]|nr:hypothetical protein BT10792_24430 [Bacillus thuringiensis]
MLFFHKKYENTRKEANFFETFAGKYCMSLRFYRIISKRKNSGRLVASANRVDVFFHSSNRYIKIDNKNRRSVR